MNKIEQLVNELVKKYINESDVCMAEFLASEYVSNLSFEEAFEVYIRCMKIVESDEFFIKRINEKIEKI